jgi:hypothetical protein
MNLYFLLDHDVCEYIINYITLEDVIVIGMLNKFAPDLMLHKNINDVFVREMRSSTMAITSNNFLGGCIDACLGATMLQNNKKIRTYVYDHQLIHTTGIKPFTIINYWLNWGVENKTKHVDVFNKILAATVDNDDSFFFFNIFINYMYEIKVEYVLNAMNKLNMFQEFDMFWNNLFGLNYPDKSKAYQDYERSYPSSKYVSYFSHPILIISLIINDKSRIKKILDYYNESRYNSVIGVFWFNDSVIKDHASNGSFAGSISICKYIKAYYPEFIGLVSSIEHNEIAFDCDVINERT